MIAINNENGLVTIQLLEPHNFPSQTDHLSRSSSFAVSYMALLAVRVEVWLGYQLTFQT